MTRYAIVTPVRDEEEHIEATIQSVANQTERPAEWVIVNDGSSDRTGALIDRWAAELPWVHAVHRPNRGFRKAGGGVVDAFYDGYRSLRSHDWDFIVKLDGDLSFSPDYFQSCFEHFAAEPKLGIGGGEIYYDLGSEQQLEACPKFHVRGATKIYRKACWEAIGGLMPIAGWDTIDEVKANMLGWRTRSFADLRLIHHRLTGAADGLWRDRVKFGAVCYTCGYHPLFLLARCVYKLVRKPYIVGSIAMFYGFVRGYFTDTPHLNDRALVRYVRAQQLRRLFGLKTIWR